MHFSIYYVSHVVSLILFHWYIICVKLPVLLDVSFCSKILIFVCTIAWFAHFIRNSSKIIISTISFCLNYGAQSSTFKSMLNHFLENGYFDWSMQFSFFQHKDIAYLLKHRHSILLLHNNVNTIYIESVSDEWPTQRCIPIYDFNVETRLRKKIIDNII